MAKVDIPVDLSSIKTTQAFGLTARQLKFAGIGALISVPIYILIYKDIGFVPGFFVFIVLFFIISSPGFFSEDNNLGREIKKQVKQKYYYKQIRMIGKEDNIVKEKRKVKIKKKANRRKR